MTTDDDWFASLLRVICIVLMLVVVIAFGLVLGAVAYIAWAGRG